MTPPAQPIPPALTPEEWEGVLDSTDEDGAASADIIEFAMGGRFHAAAAIALVSQPFGFSQEDVDALEAEWHDADCGALYALYDHECDCHKRPARERLYDLAAKIAALLPPIARP